MSIRKATRNDIEQIHGLEEIIELCFPACRETLLERLDMFPEGFFVSEESGKIRGYIESCIWDKRDFQQFSQINEFPSYHNEKGKTLFIIFLGVAPSHRKRGIATQLISAVLQLAGTLGLDQVQLVAKSGLHSFYQKQGFNDIRRFPAYLPGVTGLLMERVTGKASE